MERITLVISILEVILNANQSRSVPRGTIHIIHTLRKCTVQCIGSSHGMFV